MEEFERSVGLEEFSVEAERSGVKVERSVVEPGTIGTLVNADVAAGVVSLDDVSFQNVVVDDAVSLNEEVEAVVTSEVEASISAVDVAILTETLTIYRIFFNLSSLATAGKVR